MRAPVKCLIANLLAAAGIMAASGGLTQALAHGGEDHGDEAKPAAARAAAQGASFAGVDEGPQRLADGSLYVPKPVQRRLGILTVQVKRGELAASVELNGTIIADPESSGRIQAPFAGSVQPGPKGMPAPGRNVLRGEVLAYLRPVASAIEQGNQKSQLAELEAQLAIAERRVRRYEQLEGAVPQKEIEAARIEHGALVQRRAHVAASVDGAAPLRAPVSGILSGTNRLVAGQIVDARDILFEIVDPARLAIEALAYDPALPASIRSASALAGESVLELGFVGGGRQLREQALPLLFRVKSANAPVAVGQPLKVIAQTARTVKGAALPQAALVKVSAGETAVWVRDGAERFVLRKVGVAPLDATRAAAISGINNGERVVTEGAGLLAQVR